MTERDRPPRCARIVWQREPPFAVWRGPTRTRLKFGQALEIHFEDFPDGSTLQLTDLISVRNPGLIRFRPGEKGGIPSVIFWFELTGDDLNRQRLAIRSAESPRRRQDDPYYLEMSGFLGGSNRVWKIDPEVINRAGDGTVGRDKKARNRP